MRCIGLSGSDDRLDCKQMFYYPLNALPAKCPECKFPDLDHVPRPYFVVKSRTLTPNELALAENGNLFARDRVRKIIELVAPQTCEFWPTTFQGTSERAPWWLLVPKQQVQTATIKAKIQRCPQCGEPRSAHPGSQYDKWLWDYQSEFDILKSATWGSSERGWDRWIFRNVYMSLRLFQLLQTLQAKGLHAEASHKPPTPDDQEDAWIAEQLKLIEQQGIPLRPAGTVSTADAKWFKAFLKQQAAKSPLTIDVKAAEKGLKFKLPKSYVDFINQVGPRTFENVDELEGFTVNIVQPDKFDAQSYRHGKVEGAETDEPIDAVMFATTDHGDCLCFDIRPGQKEYAVYLYNHEFDHLEPYAETFPACIKRLHGGN